jgi:hypothetical protein
MRNPFRNQHKEELGRAFGQLDIYYHEIRNTDRDSPELRRGIVAECDEAVANAPSARVLASVGNLDLEPGVFPLKENYQQEWEDLKQDLVEDDIQERLDVIDPLTGEQQATVEAEVYEDWNPVTANADELEHETVPPPADVTDIELTDEVSELGLPDPSELDFLEGNGPDLADSEPTAVDPQLSVDVESVTINDLEAVDPVSDQPDTTVALDAAGSAVALMEVGEPAVDESSLEGGQEESGGQALADASVAVDPSPDLGIDDSPASAEAVIDEPDPDALETGPSEATAEITDAVTDAVVEPPEPEVTEPADHLARPPADPHDEMTERWVDELRSGRHQQLCGAWEDTGFFGGHTECTLQVAKNTFNVDLGVLTDKYGQPFISEILRLNDHEQQSFKQIADYIEKTQLKERRRELEMER